MRPSLDQRLPRGLLRLFGLVPCLGLLHHPRACLKGLDVLWQVVAMLVEERDQTPGIAMNFPSMDHIGIDSASDCIVESTAKEPRVRDRIHLVDPLSDGDLALF